MLKRYVFDTNLASKADVEAVLAKVPGVQDLRVLDTLQAIVVGDSEFDSSVPGTPLGVWLTGLELYEPGSEKSYKAPVTMELMIEKSTEVVPTDVAEVLAAAAIAETALGAADVKVTSGTK